MRRKIARQQRSPICTKAGATLMEVIVVIATIGVLMSLLLPAVQMARETSRRMSCSSKLHQIGIAIGNYIDVHKVFPPGLNLRDDLNGFLFAKTDLKAAFRTPFKELSCPSDPLADISYGNQSYYINDGATMESAGNGILRSSTRFVKLPEVTDGLSNTSAASERLSFDSFIHQDLDIRSLSPEQERRVHHLVSRRMPTLLEFADECQHRAGAVLPTWLITGWYDHLVPPNSPNCVNGWDQHFNKSASPAKSMHPSGVEALMADGAVRFVSNSISREVWWAVGTRNGKEVFDF